MASKMSTIDAIRFRHMTAQLTSSETTQFICKLSNLNTNILISALFHYIAQLPSNRKDDADTITELLSDTILSRQKAPNVLPNLQLKELPHALIARTASFLDQRDYAHLSECSRFLFIACNEPNQLQTLDLVDVQFEKYSNINLTRFPSIKTLRINLSKMRQLNRLNPDAPQIISNQLKCITLHQGLNSNLRCDVGKLMEHVPMNAQRITNMTLQNISSMHGLSQFLNHFENLSYLRFYHCYLDEDEYDVSSIPRIPKLRGLSVRDMEDECQKILVHAFADHLECLELEQGEDLELYGLHNIKFPKLKELVLYHPSYSTMTNLIMNAQHLRQIHMEPRYALPSETDPYGDDMYLSLEELSSRIAHMLETCNALQHLAITGYPDTIEATLQGILSGMLRTLTRKRKSLKIVVWMRTFELEDESIRLTEEALTLIERIAIAMDLAYTTQVMLVLAVATESRVNIDKINFSRLNFISREMNIYIKGDKYNIIVSKQRKIQCYDATWKLSPHELYE
eukprot:86737_1